MGLEINESEYSKYNVKSINSDKYYQYIYFNNGNYLKRNLYFKSDYDGHEICCYNKNNDLIFNTYYVYDHFEHYAYFKGKEPSNCYVHNNLLHGIRKYENSSKIKKYNRGYEVKPNTVLDPFFNNQDYYLIFKANVVIINGKKEFSYKIRLMNDDYYYDNPYPMKSRYEYSDGIIYEGYIKDNKFDGQGCILFPNGDKVEGTFKNNDIVGTATYLYKNGNRKLVTSKDIFARYNIIDNKLHDLKELYLFANKNNDIKTIKPVKSNIKSTVKSNTAKTDTNSNNILKGNKDFGLIMLDDGLFDGFMENGVPNGFGKLVKDGYLYKGLFKDGKPHGKGMIEYNNNIIQYGEFINGKKYGYFITVVKANASRNFNAWIASYYINDALEYGSEELIEYIDSNLVNYSYKSYKNNVLKQTLTNKTESKNKFIKKYKNSYFF